MSESGSGAAPRVLDELAVANLGVIGAARLDPGPGLVVVTGETGAGKTLLLGALRLLAGAPAGGDQVGPHDTEAVVEARFAVGGDELVAARRVVRGGRSRAYLDGAMCPARMLQDRVGPLVEIIGQHDALRLARPGELRAMLDRALDAAGHAAAAAYAKCWQQVAALEATRSQLGGDRRALERERDLVGFQVSEIEDAGFERGDDETLRARATRLRNAAVITEALQNAAAALGDEGGAAAFLVEGAAALRTAARGDADLQPLADDAADLVARAGELGVEISRYADRLEDDGGALAVVERRLAALGDLRRKYGDTLDDVLRFGEQAAARAAEIDAVLERAATVDQDLEVAAAALDDAGAELRAARERAAKVLADAAVGHLRELGFNDPVVCFRVDAAARGPHGADRVEVHFASDGSLTAGPLGKVASGGELTRLVLALRLAGGAGEAPIVAFDEVDAGVGGATALALGRKLAGLAVDRQVLCVTHLPQVAAFATSHVVVDRDGTEATVRAVSGPDRIEELTRMLSGLPESERGREHAEELLELAASHER